MQICPSCNAPIDGEADFCEECGTPTSDSVTSEQEEKNNPLPKKNCLNCHGPLEAGALFCEECGTPTLKMSAQSLPKKRISSKKKICPKCLKPVEADATFCEECGNSNWKSANKVKIKNPAIRRLGIVAAVVLLIIFGATQLFKNDVVEPTKKDQVAQLSEETKTVDTNPKETPSEQTDTNKTPPKNTNNKQTEWQAEPFTINDHSIALYSNETGSIEFTGYSIDDKGYYTIVIKYTGLLKYGGIDNIRYNIILANNSTFLVDVYTVEWRFTDEAKYLISRHYVGGDTEIMRVDVSSGDYNEKIKLAESKGMIEIAGIKKVETMKDFSPVKRENEDMTVILKSILHENNDLTAGKDKFHFSWVITPKKDLMGKELRFFAHHPNIENILTNTSDSKPIDLYKGTTSEFGTSLTLPTLLNKDGIHTVYFYFDKELFGIDLMNYKEVKEVPLTWFLKNNVKIDKGPTINGFVDAAGERVYEAIQSTQAKISYKPHPPELVFSMPVGDYKKLSFRLGAGEMDNAQDKPYTMTIFGEDYYLDSPYPTKNEKATVIFEDQINYNTPLAKHTVDISKQRVIYVEIDNYTENIKIVESNPEAYPVIIEGLKASK